MKQAILVNGVPASGKSTMAGELARYLVARDVPAIPLSLDTVKEGLYAHLGSGDREHNRALGRASYQAIFSSIAAFPDRLVPLIDAWHGFQSPEVVRDLISRAGIERVLEVWCRVPPETAARRYRDRASGRHPGHPPASYADELLRLTERARPLALGPVVAVDTTAPVGQDLLAEIHRILCAAD